MSRLAFEMVVEERDELRRQVAEFMGTRPGTPVGHRPTDGPIDIPGDIEDMIAEFESEAVRVAIREQLRMRMSDPTETWDRLRGELVRQIGEPEPA